jgi:uncharacterized protein YegP (UPF0339 family)
MAAKHVLTNVTPAKIIIMGKFVITKRKDQEFQFNLTAGNGEVILTSEGYVQKASCYKGIESAKVNSQDDFKYHRRTSANKKDYFVLKAGNGEIIGVSQLYSSKESMEEGIISAKSNVPTVEIDDKTFKS